MQTRRLALLPLALVGALAAAGCATRPAHRYFQPTVDQVGPELNSYGEAVVPRHGLIVVQGDDFAYGLARGRSRHVINDASEGQSAITISQTLRKVLPGVTVENRGFPGDTVSASAARWAGRPPGDLLILSFGFGDQRAHTSTHDFDDALARMIDAAHASGAAVFVVIPPPSSDPVLDFDLSSYRGNAFGIAQQTHAQVFDASAAMGRLRIARVKGAAQPAAVYQGVAADMAAYIKVVPSRPAAPQTGQAGSGESRTVRVSPASAS